MAKDELEFNLGDLLEGNPKMEDTIPKNENTEETTKETSDSDELEFDINSAFEAQENEDTGDTVQDEKSEKAPSTTGVSKETKRTDESSVSIPLAFARYQLERGNLTDLNEEEFQKVINEEGEDAAYAYLFQNEVSKNVEAARNELLEQYEPEVREYLGLREAGIDANSAKGLTQSKKFYDELNVADLEDDANEKIRTQVLKDYYKKTTKFTDKKIEKLVDSHISIGEDIDAAKEAADEMKKIYEEEIKEQKISAQQQQEQFAKTNEEQLKALKKRIDEKEEMLPGYKINKQTKDKIYDMITKPVAEDPNGMPLNAIWDKRSKDPFAFDTMVAYLDVMGVFDGKVDKLLKPAKKETVDSLSNILRTSGKFGSKPAGMGGSGEVPDLAKSLGSLLGVKDE